MENFPSKEVNICKQNVVFAGKYFALQEMQALKISSRRHTTYGAWLDGAYFVYFLAPWRFCFVVQEH